MSYTLHTTTAAATGLIAQPGRAVNTFPSGLVRVDQTYIGRTALASTHRATLAVGNDMPDGDTSPCIDGLKIFPEAQERRREDGFTEYIVSAYGRSNTTGKTTAIAVKYPQEFTFSKEFSTLYHPGGTWGQSFDFKATISTLTNLSAEKVEPYSAVLTPPTLDSSLLNFSISTCDITNSVPTAANYATPNNQGRYYPYFLGFSNYAVSGLPNANGFLLTFSAIIDNPIYSSIDPNHIPPILATSGSRVTIGEAQFSPKIDQKTNLRNFGSFNEMVLQVTVS